MQHLKVAIIEIEDRTLKWQQEEEAQDEDRLRSVAEFHLYWLNEFCSSVIQYGEYRHDVVLYIKKTHGKCCK